MGQLGGQAGEGVTSSLHHLGSKEPLPGLRFHGPGLLRDEQSWMPPSPLSWASFCHGKLPGPFTEVCPPLCYSNLLIYFLPRMKNLPFLSLVINFPIKVFAAHSELPLALAASPMLLQGRLLCFSPPQTHKPRDGANTQKTRSTNQTQLQLHQQEGKAPEGLCACQMLPTPTSTTHQQSPGLLPEGSTLQERRAPGAQDEARHQTKGAREACTYLRRCLLMGLMQKGWERRIRQPILSP